MKPFVEPKGPVNALPKKPRKKLGDVDYRDPSYDNWAEFYSKRYHGVPESELSPYLLAHKTKLRQWLNAESGKRRKPDMFKKDPKLHSKRS